MKSIIVGTDFSDGSFVALDIAVDIANKINRNIRLIWVQKEKMLLDGDQMNAVAKLAAHRLQELCDDRADKLHNIKIIPEILQGKVASVIGNEARKYDSPIIIIGTNGASGFEKYWMGSTAVRIIQESPCPVLTIREGFNFHKKLEKIVVPIRVNLTSRQKVPIAAQMAKLFTSNIYVLGLIDTKQNESDLNTYIKQTEAFMTKENIKFNYEIRNYNNYTDDVLAYASEINADLIVINTEQDRVLAQLFLGTNAQQIVHKSQIPILCIHPKDIFGLAK